MKCPLFNSIADLDLYTYQLRSSINSIEIVKIIIHNCNFHNIGKRLKYKLL